jgi:divalent metal cation (Fe/Co/Zn/Cd) transporter
MQELVPTWKNALSVWWLITWRGLVGFIFLVFAIAVLVDSLATLIGGRSGTFSIIGAIGAWVLSIFWGLVVVRMALRKRYRHFRVALIGNAADPASHADALTS